MLLLLTVSCQEEEKYSASVVRQLEMTLDGEPWSLRAGENGKPLVVFTAPDGEYVANYTTQYRFQLGDGSYYFIATTDAVNLFPDSTIANGLHEAVIKQMATADLKIQVSDPIACSSPFGEVVKLPIKSRTGTIRLVASDLKQDKRYTSVRTTVTSPRSAYHVGTTKFEEKAVSLVRSKTTNSGGVGYADNFIVFITDAEGVSVKFELLDSNGTVVETRQLAGKIDVYPGVVSEVSFELNNASEPVIQDYTVTIVDEEWTDETIVPEIPVVAPEGYVYVAPGDDLDAIFNTLKADDEVETIQLYLKAGESYELGKSTLNDLPKGFVILAQKPSEGQEKAKLKINGSVSLGQDTGTPIQLDKVVFENLAITQGGRFFYYKNQDFEVETIKFKDCDFVDLSADFTMWYQSADGDYMQVCHNFTIDGCQFINLDLGSSALLGLGTKNILPIYNITIKNSTFHMKDLASPLVSNLQKIDKTLTVDIQNNTFVNAGTSTATWLNFDARGSDEFNLIIKNNLMGGSAATASGTWTSIRVTNTLNKTIEGNYTASDYVLTWGVDEVPTISASSTTELFDDPINGNLTLAPSSDAYSNNAGDPRWIK